MCLKGPEDKLEETSASEPSEPSEPRAGKKTTTTNTQEAFCRSPSWCSSYNTRQRMGFQLRRGFQVRTGFRLTRGFRLARRFRLTRGFPWIPDTVSKTKGLTPVSLPRFASQRCSWQAWQAAHGLLERVLSADSPACNTFRPVFWWLPGIRFLLGFSGSFHLTH